MVILKPPRTPEKERRGTLSNSQSIKKELEQADKKEGVRDSCARSDSLVLQIEPNGDVTTMLQTFQDVAENLGHDKLMMNGYATIINNATHHVDL